MAENRLYAGIAIFALLVIVSSVVFSSRETPSSVAEPTPAPVRAGFTGPDSRVGTKPVALPSAIPIGPTPRPPGMYVPEQDVADGQDHPLVPRFPDSVIVLDEEFTDHMFCTEVLNSEAGLAACLSESTQASVISYLTPADIDEVLRFYDEKLKASGWEVLFGPGWLDEEATEGKVDAVWTVYALRSTETSVGVMIMRRKIGPSGPLESAPTMVTLRIIEPASTTGAP